MCTRDGFPRQISRMTDRGRHVWSLEVIYELRGGRAEAKHLQVFTNSPASGAPQEIKVTGVEGRGPVGKTPTQSCYSRGSINRRGVPAGGVRVDT